MESTGENKAEQSREPKKVDTGLVCLVMVAGYHGLAVDPEQLRHTLALGSEGMGIMDILRAAKELGLKAKEAQVSYDRLNRLPMPALALMEDRKFNVLAKIDGDRVLVFDPLDGRPRLISKDEFLQRWQKRIILITYRKSVAPSEKDNRSGCRDLYYGDSRRIITNKGRTILPSACRCLTCATWG